MNGFIRRRRIFYSEIAAEIAPGHEILGLAGGAAIFETRRDGSVAAAIDADAAGVVEGVGLGLDVEDTRGAQAVLRGQCAGQQRKAADDAGIEDLPESADAVGEHNAVDAVRQIGVLVAHMQLAAGRRVLGDAGHLQQHLVELCVGALRHCLDGLMVDLIGVGADWTNDVLASRVQFLVVPRQNLRRGLRRRGGRLAAFPGQHALSGPAWRLGYPRRGDGDFRELRCRRRCGGVLGHGAATGST